MKAADRNSDLAGLFAYRDVWMGLGILLVVFFHSPVAAEGIPVLGRSSASATAAWICSY